MNLIWTMDIIWTCDFIRGQTSNHELELQTPESAPSPPAEVLCASSSAQSCLVLVPVPTFDPCSNTVIVKTQSSHLNPFLSLPHHGDLLSVLTEVITTLEP